MHIFEHCHFSSVVCTVGSLYSASEHRIFYFNFNWWKRPTPWSAPILKSTIYNRKKFATTNKILETGPHIEAWGTSGNEDAVTRQFEAFYEFTRNFMSVNGNYLMQTTLPIYDPTLILNQSSNVRGRQISNTTVRISAITSIPTIRSLLIPTLKIVNQLYLHICAGKFFG